jgi:hypothetical protein
MEEFDIYFLDLDLKSPLLQPEMIYKYLYRYKVLDMV